MKLINRPLFTFQVPVEKEQAMAAAQMVTTKLLEMQAVLSFRSVSTKIRFLKS